MQSARRQHGTGRVHVVALPAAGHLGTVVAHSRAACQVQHRLGFVQGIERGVAGVGEFGAQVSSGGPALR